MHAGEAKMNAMVRRVREPGLDLAGEITADDSRNGRHFEPSVAEFVKSDGLTDGADQEIDSDGGEDHEDQAGRIFLFEYLGSREEGNGEGNYVPKDGEEPAGDGIGFRLTFDSALSPVFAPEPGLGG